MECSAAFASPLLLNYQDMNPSDETFELIHRWRVEFPTHGRRLVPKGLTTFQAMWMLILEDVGGLIKIDFVQRGPGWTNDFSFIIAILDNKNRISKESEFHGTDTGRTRIEYERCKYVYPGSPYLKDNKLTILCHIFNPKTTTQVRSSREISPKLRSLMEDKKFTDAVIRVDGKECDVHKIVLAASSSVFAAMFDHDSAEANQNCIEIKDFDYPTVEEFLRFIYKGEFSKNINLLRLLACADKYNVDTLKEQCEDALKDKLTVGNAAEVLYYADLHGAATLKKKAIEFITYNIEAIYFTEEWQSLSKELTSQVIFAMAGKIKQK